MDRRDFLKGAAALALTAGIAGKLTGAEQAAPETKQTSGKPDLVALRGGSPGDMFDAGIALLGGISAFVKPGNVVLVKPNIGWDKAPETGADTNPELIGRIVRRCMEAGAKEVHVFDHTCDNWVNSYSNSGIKAAVEAAGGKMVSGAVEADYREVEIPGGVSMKKAQVHRLVLDCDVFFNVPVLKHHGGAGITMGMKNLMGTVWNRGEFHSKGLHQCIADASLVRRPDLTVIDAYRMLTRNGPRGTSASDVTVLKAQILSTDIVAGDCAGARIFGLDPKDVGHIRLGAELGAGTMDLESLGVERIVL